ncbi:MAG: DUF58 domain-containing protein, partial [Candidatus Omnitrophica bacterium]|nr:DUF58 domain-containing protein [Candidatus Omnitrophota bacterium]
SFQPIQTLNLPLSQRHQPGGLAFGSHCGDSPEYVGNREYRPGDPARRIDFRSWARLARPVVKEYQEEYYSRVGLVLDTFIGPRQSAKREMELEAAISLTAAIAEVVCQGESVVDLFAAGSTLHTFRAGRSIGQVQHILDILACLEGSYFCPFEKILPSLTEEYQGMSAVIFVFLRWDEIRRQLVQRAREGQSVSRVILVKKDKLAVVVDLDGKEIVQVTPEEVKKGLLDQ